MNHYLEIDSTPFVSRIDFRSRFQGNRFLNSDSESIHHGPNEEKRSESLSSRSLTGRGRWTMKERESNIENKKCKMAFFDCLISPPWSTSI